MCNTLKYNQNRMIKLTNLLNEKELKAVFFEGLFENKVIRLPYAKDGKLVDFTLACTNQSLNNFFNNQYNKYKKKNTHQDFMAECMFWSNKAIERFQVRDGGSWEGILDDTDKPNIGRLITNIKNTVEFELIRYMNNDVKYAKKTIDGESKHVKYKFSMASLDSILLGAEGEETALVNIVAEDMGYWSPKMGYQANHFKQWFEENAERILTKSQYQLIENLKKSQHQQDGYTRNDVYAVTGVSDKNLATYMKRIRERILKAFEKENPMGQKTQLEMYKDAEIKLWTGLLELVYVEETDNMNANISAWLLANLDNEKVSNMLYDNITAKESIAVTSAYKSGGVIPAKVLYTVIAKVEDRLDYLAQMDTTSVKFYKKESEMGRWTPEAHKAYNNSLKDWKQQECLVYDKDGNLLRKEAWKPFSNKDKHIYEVLPSGVIHKLDTSN
jgi:hypothetical protein